MLSLPTRTYYIKLLAGKLEILRICYRKVDLSVEHADSATTWLKLETILIMALTPLSKRRESLTKAKTGWQKIIENIEI